MSRRAAQWRRTESRRSVALDRLVEQVKPQAEKRIKQRLVLEAVAEAEKFEITEQDVEDELKRIAEIYGMDVESVKDRFGEKEIAEVKKDLAILFNHEDIDTIVHLGFIDEDEEYFQEKILKAGKVADENDVFHRQN